MNAASATKSAVEAAAQSSTAALAGASGAVNHLICEVVTRGPGHEDQRLRQGFGTT
jgi:hypothetical protein